jgi:HK97 family phage major capsid protein
MGGINEHVKNLNEVRMTVWNEAQGFLARVADQKRDMNEEEKAQWGRYNARLTELESERDMFIAREQREAESAQSRLAFDRRFGTGSFAMREDQEGDMLRRFLRGDPEVGDVDPEDMGKRILRVPVRSAMRERELIRQGAGPVEARALAWDTGSVGSAVPTIMANTLYEYLEASIAVWRMPTRKLNTSTGANFDLPTLTAHAIGTQVSGQGTLLAGTDPTFSKTTFNAYKFGELCLVANEVITDVQIDISEFLGRDMGRALGRVIATDLVTGSGSGKIHGCMTALSGGGAGSVTTGGSLIDPTYETLIDLQYAVNDSYRNQNSAWLMRDATAGVLRKLRDGAGGTEGAPLWQPSVTMGIAAGVPDRLLGFPTFTDPNVASIASNARVMAFGAWDSYWVRHVGDIVIERSTDYKFGEDQTAVRAKWRVDGDLVDYDGIASMVVNV